MLARTAICILAVVTALAAQDPLTVRAADRIATVEKAAANLADGDRAAAERLLNQLGWAGKRLDVVNDKSDSHWLAAKARYDALRASIESKANAGRPSAGTAPKVDPAVLRQLAKEVRNGYDNFKIVPTKNLADDFRRKSITAELAKLRERLDALPQQHADVQAIATDLARFETEFAAAIGRLDADGDAKSAVEARLSELGAKYRSTNRPTVLEHPFSEPRLRTWSMELRRWRDRELPQDIEWLRSTAARNATIDQQQVGNLVNWLDSTWRRNLADLERTVRERIASDVRVGLDAARFILETEVTDRDQVANRILGKGRFDEQMTRLADASHAVAMARVYDEAMGTPAVFDGTARDPEVAAAKPDRAAELAIIERATQRLRELARLALDAVRLPKSASDDPKLVAIASETLRRPEYEVAGWERLVVNTTVVRRTRREAYATPQTTRVRIDYYEYVWDEYQVTTVEKVEDELWLFANTLKHYHSGDPTTPVGKWILSRRFELTPILPEHARD